jgi:hypothetical protein
MDSWENKFEIGPRNRRDKKKNFFMVYAVVVKTKPHFHEALKDSRKFRQSCPIIPIHPL